MSQETGQTPDGARVHGLYRYPVKGLSPDSLTRVNLGTGETIAFDRAYAIENGHGRFDAQAPRHLPKINFLMLMRDERLARLTTQFNESDQTLSVLRDGKQVARGNLGTRLGRQMIEQFLSAYMKDALRGPPKIVMAERHSFSDVAQKCVHIVNLASVRELERVCGRAINPLRFRPNVIVDGMAPWSEFDLVDQDFLLGSARMKGFCRTQRCAATNVDPVTAARDMAIPAILERTWGHSDFGIYATVEGEGTVSINDGLAVIDA